MLRDSLKVVFLVSILCLVAFAATPLPAASSETEPMEPGTLDPIGADAEPPPENTDWPEPAPAAQPSGDPLGGEPPTVGLDPASLEATAETGQVAVRLFSATNLTGSEIDFELFARPADDGSCTPAVAYRSSFLFDSISRVDLVTGQSETLIPSTFRPNNNIPLSRDGKRLYYTVSTSSGTLYVLDLVSGETTRLTDFDDDLRGPVGLALDFAETTLYVSEDQAGRVRALDLATGLFSDVASGIFGAQGMALDRDETRLYVGAVGGLVEIDLTSGQTRTFGTGGSSHLFDVVLSSDEKTAYVSDNPANRVLAIDLATGNVTTVISDVINVDGLALDPFDRTLYFGRFDVATTSPVMVALDLPSGQLRTVTGGETTGVALDIPRGCRAEYLRFAPDDGNLPPFGTLDVQATFDTLDLLDGVYQAEILVRDATTDTALAVAPATFTVIGFPDIRVVTDPIDFGDLFLGLSESVDLVVSNDGRKRLNLTLSTDPSVFTVSPQDLSIPPESSVILTVAFLPDAVSQFDGMLSLSSDDPDSPLLTIPLSGRGLLGPEIELNPGAVDVSLVEQGETTVEMTITNRGGEPLEFYVTPSPAISTPTRPGVCFPDRVLWLDDFASELVGLDLVTGAIDATPLDPGPLFDLELNRAQTRAYVSRFDFDQILVVELTTGEARTIGGELSFPLGLAVSADETVLYAAEWFDGTIARLDLATGDVERLTATFFQPTGLVFSPDELTLYVSDQRNQLSAIDLATGEVSSTVFGLFDPDLGLEIDPSGSTVWAANGRIRNGRVSAVDLATGEIEPVVTNLVWPRGLAVEGDKAWVAEVSGPVSEIDLATGATTPLDPGNNSLTGLELECATYVSAEPRSGIVLSGETATVTLQIRAGDLPIGSYGARLTISSNDPAAPQITVPVDLEVVPANQPPVAVCRDVTVAADLSCLAVADVDGGAFDPDGDPISVSSSPPGPYGLGANAVTLTVTDPTGASDSCTATVTVIDVTPPDISAVVEPGTLWPPNHRMIDVEALVSATDNCGAPEIALDAITSNEPDDGDGDGATTDDVQGAEPGSPDFDFRLRAERSGGGAGRSYTIVYTATDGSGNAATATATVFVPHDQGGVTDPVQIAIESVEGGARVLWNAIPGATGYDVIRGELDQIASTGQGFDLGATTCLEAGSTDTSSPVDLQLPPPGRAFFYLVQYRGGGTSSYGSVSADLPRLAGVGCD